MKRFVLASALAVALGFGFAGTADAQIVYGYTMPNAGGIASGRTVIVPGGYRTTNAYYSPFTGVMAGQTYYTDVWGRSFGRTYGYNPWTGIGYNTGYYQPNYYLNPYGGYNYGFVRRWGW
jgi:hypothetical protein